MKKGNGLRTLFLVVVIVTAVVLGRVLGEAAGQVPALSWLNMGVHAGIDPVTVDLAVLTLTFGISISINVAQSLLVIVAVVLASKLRI